MTKENGSNAKLAIDDAIGSEGGVKGEEEVYHLVVVGSG